MVSTRASSRAASAVPEPSPPPTAESSASSSPVPASALPPPSSTPRPRTPAARKRRSMPRKPAYTGAAARDSPSWSHAPTTLTLVWLAIAIPLVVWDAVYTLGRPHTFEGGRLHWPLYVPYELYAKIDLVYSPKHWEDGNGFCGAQGFMNAVETAMYLLYLYLFLARAEPPIATGKGKGARRTLSGRDGALAVLIGFSAAVMTLSKTLLYFAHEYFSGFDNIGHNSTRDLVVLWILPNGPWILMSAYMVWSYGKDILNGLTMASGPARKA